MENKELEALDKIMASFYELCEDANSNEDNYQKYNLTSPHHIVKKGLERLEKLEQENKNLKNALEISLSENQKLRKENYKYQKAIEIAKRVGFHYAEFVLNFNNYTEYLLEYCENPETALIKTKEEFNLLKEVFGK